MGKAGGGAGPAPAPYVPRKGDANWAVKKGGEAGPVT